jgi:hypothetical protein
MVQAGRPAAARPLASGPPIKDRVSDTMPHVGRISGLPVAIACASTHLSSPTYTRGSNALEESSYRILP